MEKLKNLSLMLLCAVVGLSFAACSDDDESTGLSQSELSLKAGQSAKLIYDGKCTWASDEPLIAEVDQEGNVTAVRVGETHIRANDDACSVTVSPRYHTYMEPCIEWGASKSLVDTFMAGYNFVKEEDNAVSYIDDDHTIGYVYFFESGTLIASAVIVNILSVGTELADFLTERYVAVDVDADEYTMVMLSVDQELTVGIQAEADSGFMYIVYAATSTLLRTKSIVDQLDWINLPINQRIKSSPVPVSEIDSIMSQLKAKK